MKPRLVKLQLIDRKGIVKCLFFVSNSMTNTMNFATIIIGDTMNTRKIAYGFLCLGFLLLMTGGFSSFIISLKDDHQQVLHRMEDVSGLFEGFSTKTTAFEEFRDELYNDVLGNVYYDTMVVTDDAVKEKLREYEAMVDDLTGDAKKMNSLCGNVYYPQASVNSMCENYKSIYEQVVNYFVTDIATYNESVQKYNDYQKAIKSDLFVSEYQARYRYIDYNGDKVFDGKE